MKHSWRNKDGEEWQCTKCKKAVTTYGWADDRTNLALEGCSLAETRPTDAPTVTNLPHYLTGGVEAIDAIEAWGLNFRLANVIKYIARCGKKPGVEAVDDLRKARAYLSREIASLEGRHAWE